MTSETGFTTAGHKRIEEPRFEASYDDIGDVMYVLAGPHEHTKNIEKEPGLVLRYNVITRTPVGVTIHDYKYYWRSHHRHLEEALANFFSIPVNEAARILGTAEHEA